MTKRFAGLLACLAFSFGLLSSGAAEAWKHQRVQRFQPRFSLSIAGGLTLYDGVYYDAMGEYTATAFSQAQTGVGAHFWVHPNFSLDLGLDANFVADYDTGEGWAYLSLKPGVRARVSIFYFRAALDLAFGDPDHTMLFGFLLGVGVRIPIGRTVRFFSELDYQFLFASDYGYMPFNFKLGLEFMF
jgi:hypothetical protein